MFEQPADLPHAARVFDYFVVIEISLYTDVSPPSVKIRRGDPPLPSFSEEAGTSVHRLTEIGFMDNLAQIIKPIFYVMTQNS